MKIVIPELPVSLNRLLRMHYRARMRERDKWVLLVRKYAGPVGVRFARAQVRLTYFFRDGRRRDPDNYAGKLIMDALVACGLLVDDSFSHVDLLLSGGVDKDAPRTEIEVVGIDG